MIRCFKIFDKEINALVSDKRKKQVALAVKTHRDKLEKEMGRKQVPLMLTDTDRANMAKIKQNESSVKNQGEAVSKALSEFVKKYDEKSV